jgi:hypothetical protein
LPLQSLQQLHFAPTSNGKAFAAWPSPLSVPPIPLPSQPSLKILTQHSVVGVRSMDVPWLTNMHTDFFFYIFAHLFSSNRNCLLIHPDVQDEDESKLRNFTINFGPQHPAAHVSFSFSIF